MNKALVLLFTSIILTSCGNEDDVLKEKIVAEITQTKQLDLSRYNNFVWDKLIILEPYSNLKKIEKSQDISLFNVDGEIEELDDINLLVFLKDKKAVKSVNLKRKFGDFENYNTLIPKSTARFILKGNISSMKPPILEIDNKL